MDRARIEKHFLTGLARLTGLTGLREMAVLHILGIR
jgi:hypothetical protein